jgi:hypothetical protein
MKDFWNDIDFIEGCVIGVCLLMMAGGAIAMVML